MRNSITGGISSRLAEVLWQPEELGAIYRQFGLSKADQSELSDVHVFCETLMSRKLTELSVLERVHEECAGAAWIFKESEITGIALSIPLTQSGAEAMWDGSFTADNPPTEHVARAGTPLYGCYVWLIGGSTKTGRKAVMQALVTAQTHNDNDVLTFGRAASEEGARVMEATGYVPVNPNLPDIYVSSKASRRRLEAA